MSRGHMLRMVDTAGAIMDEKEIQIDLQAALLDGEMVEVEMDDMVTEHYRCRFADHPPEDEDTPYRPASYIAKREYLLVTPMEPAKGNAMIRRAKKIRIRFHDGTVAVQGYVTFTGVIMVRGTQSIQLSFPEKLVKFMQRQTTRAKVTDMVLKVVVKRAGEEPFEAEVDDISMTGLSARIPDDAPDIAEQKKVALTILSRDLGNIELSGVVRKWTKSRSKDDVFKAHRIAGIQFDQFSGLTLVKKVEDLVSMVDKRYQQLVKRRRLQFMSGGGE